MIDAWMTLHPVLERESEIEWIKQGPASLEYPAI